MFSLPNGDEKQGAQGPTRLFLRSHYAAYYTCIFSEEAAPNVQVQESYRRRRWLIDLCDFCVSPHECVSMPRHVPVFW